MDDRMKADYERMRDAVRIDTMNIDQELVRLPEHILLASDSITHLMALRDGIDIAVKQAKLHAAMRLRDPDITPKKPAEAAITEMVAVDADVLIKAHRQDMMVRDVRLWSNVLEALQSKERALKQYCPLILAGFVSPRAGAVLQGPTREALAAKRAEAGGMPAASSGRNKL